MSISVMNPKVNTFAVTPSEELEICSRPRRPQLNFAGRSG